MVLPYGNVGAAVPVEVVEFSMGTNFEESLEKFMFNLFNELQKRDQDFTAAFELQKIEKAREDVNKLIYATQRELVGYSGAAGAVGGPVLDPVTGATLLIKKPGRIIHNIDNFLYEEPIQKGRDFLYCYFGGDLSPGVTPWKTFPFADTPSESIMLQKKLRDKLLTRIQRKASWTLTAPPQTWYTQELCSRILASFPITSECFDKPPSPECPTKSTKNYQPTFTKSLGATKKDRGYFTISELSETTLNPNNTYQGVYEYIGDVTQTIIGQYAGLRYAEYIAGQGIQPERAYIAEFDKANPEKAYFWDTDYIISPAVILLQKMQAATQAQFDLAQKAYLNMPWWTPNSVLEDYNLKEVASTAIYNKDGVSAGSLLPHTAPNVPQNPLVAGTLEFKSTTGSQLWGGLPAPWEDNFTYMNLSTGPGVDQYRPDLYMYPPHGIPPASLNEQLWNPNISLTNDSQINLARRPTYRWFRDVLELYKYFDPMFIPSGTHLGWQELLKKWFIRNDLLPTNPF